MRFTNPIIFADFPDLDVIRVSDVYYMITTTMHLFPGGQILRSRDLVHWQHAAYLYDRLGETPAQRLDGGAIYGKGMWAATLRLHEGLFHAVFACNDTRRSYHFTAERPEGPWVQQKMEGFFHDSSLLFDDDGRVYIAHGNRQIRITELESDLSGPKPGGLDRVALRDSDDIPLGFEGSHFYKIGGRYYLFCIHWPATGTARRTQVCFRADSIDGEFTGGTIVDDDMGFHNMGVAQGGVVDTPEGDWYLMLFQDRGAAGRMPVLAPIKWRDGWPCVGPIPRAGEIRAVRLPEPVHPLYASDPLTSLPLSVLWQWNHEPHDELWSVSAEGLRLRTDRVVSGLEQSVNTLTQRVFGPECETEVTVDASSLQEGDYAGISAFMGCYAELSVTPCGQTGFELALKSREADGTFLRLEPSPEEVAQRVRIPIGGPKVRLMARFDFRNMTDKVQMFYDANGSWVPAGEPHQLVYRLDHFTGCRTALHCYSTRTPGGSAVFSNFQFRLAKRE